MSDNYFSLGTDYTHFYNYDPEWDHYKQNYLTFYAKWGIQRRLLKHGIADIGLKTGFITGTNKAYDLSFYFNTYVDMGLALTKDRYKLNREKLCPVLKCYESQKYQLKSDLSSLFYVLAFQENKFIGISPSLAFEYKLGKSPFSINTELGTTFRYEPYAYSDTEIFYSNTWQSKLEVESRWYYNLHRRIIKGKSGNGLSASYIALGGSYNYEKNKFYQQQTYFYPKVYAVAGWQRLISKHLYYDIQLGMEKSFHTKIDDTWGMRIKTEPWIQILGNRDLMV